MDEKLDIQKLADEIKKLKEELHEREQSLPAHSIRPHQLQAIEELEQRIAVLEGKAKGSPENSSPHKG